MGALQPGSKDSVAIANRRCQTNIFSNQLDLLLFIQPDARGYFFQHLLESLWHSDSFFFSDRRKPLRAKASRCLL